nr:hypothetical protein [Acidobacteriota bacterium]
MVYVTRERNPAVLLSPLPRRGRTARPDPPSRRPRTAALRPLLLVLLAVLLATTPTLFATTLPSLSPVSELAPPPPAPGPPTLAQTLRAATRPASQAARRDALGSYAAGLSRQSLPNPADPESSQSIAAPSAGLTV